MKKFICCIFSLFLIISLCSCGIKTYEQGYDEGFDKALEISIDDFFNETEKDQRTISFLLECLYNSNNDETVYKEDEVIEMGNFLFQINAEYTYTAELNYCYRLNNDNIVNYIKHREDYDSFYLDNNFPVSDFLFFYNNGYRYKILSNNLSGDSFYNGNISYNNQGFLIDSISDYDLNTDINELYILVVINDKLYVKTIELDW